METVIISNNRVLSAKDYERSLKISYPTALKYLKDDRHEFSLPRITAVHFFKIYGSWPKNFRPVPL